MNKCDFIAYEPHRYMLWTIFVRAQNKTVMIQGRAVIPGDYISTRKDGRRMLGVVALHQDSESQSKPSFFRGHFWGAICLVVGSMAAPFGLPLDLKSIKDLSISEKIRALKTNMKH